MASTLLAPSRECVHCGCPFSIGARWKRPAAPLKKQNCVQDTNHLLLPERIFSFAGQISARGDYEKYAQSITLSCYSAAISMEESYKILSATSLPQ